MKKIMFNDRYGLEQAVLAWLKTMTRRIAYDGKMRYEPHFGFNKKGQMVLLDGWKVVATSRYAIGEEVAIAQSYKVTAQQNREWLDLQLEANGQYIGELMDSGGWENKMFVSDYYCPNHIRIKNIKAERLQDISEEDAMREGVFKYDKPPLHHEMDMFAPWPPYIKPYKWDGNNLIYRYTARYAFAYLIDKISGRGTWNRNPWVFAYEFELIK